MTTLALSPSLALTRFANSSVDWSNSEPGAPTCPNLISVCAAAPPADHSSARATAVKVLLSNIDSSQWPGERLRPDLGRHVAELNDAGKRSVVALVNGRLARQRDGELLDVVAHHIDVGRGRTGRFGQGVGEDLAADLGDGLFRNPLEQPVVGDVLQEHHRNCLFL